MLFAGGPNIWKGVAVSASIQFSIITWSCPKRIPLGSSFHLSALILWAKLLKNLLNKKLVGYRKVHAITSPLPHTNPFYGTTRKQVPREKHHFEQANSFPTSLPFQPQGQRYLWGRMCHRRTPRGPEREPAYLEKGCMAVTVGEGEKDKIWAQNFKQRTAQVRTWK